MKKQTKSNIKAHLLRSASYMLLLLAVCVVPFTLGQPGSRGTSQQPGVQAPIMSSWAIVAHYPVVIQSPAVASDGTYAYAGTGFWFGPSNSFYRYDPVANSWTALPNTPLAVGQARAVYAANTHSIYIFGGRDNSGTVLNTTQIYNVNANTWSTGAPMPDGRIFVNVAYYPVNGKVYVMGGIDSNSYQMNQTWEYDPVANTWDTSRASIPMGMARSGASRVGQYIYLAGTEGNGTGSSAHYRYDIVANSWAAMAPVPVPIWDPAAAGVGQYTYLIGGNGAAGIFYNSTYIYDTVSNTWTSGPNTWVRHGYATGTAIGNRLLVTGGADGSQYTDIVETTLAAGSTTTVSNLNDSGAGSLREALADAYDGDTINFSATGTFTLSSGQLMVDKSVTINGPGANQLAVNGNAASRVFYISPGKTVTISGLTITNGSAPAYSYGGGIYNDHATLTLKNCTISGNEAWQGVGGGISNDQGTLTVSNCTISGNSSLYGAGISTNWSWEGNATVTIANSTISGNSVPGFGGGIHNEGGAALTIISSTLSGNSAGYDGGGISNAATVTITNSTLSGNSVTYEHGGGIFNESGTVNIGNTILNAGASGENIYNQYGSGTVTSLGYNLSSDDGGGHLTATDDQINTDPRLGPLQDNGGSIFTHLPASDSPAINGGDPALGMDQRGAGFPRVVNGRIDIGAIEAQAAPTPTATPKPHGRK